MTDLESLPQSRLIRLLARDLAARTKDYPYLLHTLGEMIDGDEPDV